MENVFFSVIRATKLTTFYLETKSLALMS